MARYLILTKDSFSPFSILSSLILAKAEVADILLFEDDGLDSSHTVGLLLSVVELLLDEPRLVDVEFLLEILPEFALETDLLAVELTL